MEQIIKIEEHQEEVRWSSMSGYAIATNEQVIKLLIDDDQSCCENWGYFMSEDDFNDFIGAELIDVKITDTELKEGLLKKHDLDIEDEYFEGDVMFVDIITSKGTLQFVAYNEHNGYYGHEARVISKQINHDEVL
ncbi:hypothetical protein COL60_16535 [Bacillus pseudomycoides]|uniref:DUF7448 domain-containing protein n=1 Tax=Bacillus pseudomycoides TaxID=64104 RepID=UPI000BF4CF85|nr:hypothetical protein [Bacillus pseudomycoides]PFZ08433.1 hypothetical protein COL60_16535 [Bacillus pseudomycoides]PFZ09829.1 hypothetical protein COL63_21415 [Bacillus pseudomycoides]